MTHPGGDMGPPWEHAPSLSGLQWVPLRPVHDVKPLSQSSVANVFLLQLSGGATSIGVIGRGLFTMATRVSLWNNKINLLLTRVSPLSIRGSLHASCTIFYFYF